MKSSDEVLDHVLHGLADAQPSGGLEDRVLANVRARALSPAPWHASRRPRALLALPMWGFPAAGLAILATASVFYVRHHVPLSGSAKISPVSQPALTAMPTVSDTASAIAQANAPHEPVSQGKESSAHATRASTPVPPSVVPCDCVSPTTQGLAMQELAMQEWHAPSLVAPELPLTHEERLLQGFAYRGNTEELAVLTPAFRAAENAREQAEFQHFFKKTTNGDNE